MVKPAAPPWNGRLMAGTIEIEDYTNFQYNAMMLAGMHGFDFIQVLEGTIETDLFRKRTFMGENKYRIIKSPYTGKDILTVPAINPDVCIVHVQRADKYGNAQYWGALGSVAAAALASKRIILSCEEIVEHDVIQSSPHLTIIPAFRVDALIEIPWNAHPTEVLGYYNIDFPMYGMFSMADTTADGHQSLAGRVVLRLQGPRGLYRSLYFKVWNRFAECHKGEAILFRTGQLWFGLYIALG